MSINQIGGKYFSAIAASSNPLFKTANRYSSNYARGLTLSNLMAILLKQGFNGCSTHLTTT